MPNPKTPQPKKAIDWQRWKEFLEKVGPPALSALEMLLTLLAGQQPAVQAGQPLKCGPDGCQVCCECLDASITAQVSALALALQARDCPDCSPSA